MDFQTFELFVTELSAPIAHLAKRYWRKPFLVEEKADSSPVTKADKEIEAFIRGSIDKSFCDDGILGEEQERTKPEAKGQWVIDPIDGTKGFIAGEDEFCTLIAYCYDNAPIFGAIYQPIRDELWLGDGVTTTFNGEITRSRQKVALANAAIATTSLPYFNEQELKQYAELRVKAATAKDGGDAYNAGLMANGLLDIFPEAGLKPYDIMALIPILRGCGATVSDWSGDEILLGAETYSLLAAGDKTLHNAALKVLQDAA